MCWRSRGIQLEACISTGEGLEWRLGWLLQAMILEMQGVRIAWLKLVGVAVLEVSVVGVGWEILERLQGRGNLVQVQRLRRQMVERQLRRVHVSQDGVACSGRVGTGLKQR